MKRKGKEKKKKSEEEMKEKMKKIRGNKYERAEEEARK